MHIKLSKLQCLTLTAMLGAIIAVLTFTPLGFPQIPLVGSATIIHIPVIIGAIIMGPKYGAALGFMFGLSSMLAATFVSVALNRFAFTPFHPVPGTESGSLWAIVIAFGPRILVGVVAALVYIGIMKLASILPLPKSITAPRAFAAAVAAGVASMTNTLLVLNLLYFIFREPWSLARTGSANPDVAANPQITYAFITATIAGFGVPEAIAAIIIVPAVCIAIFTVAKRMPQKQGTR